MKRDKFYLRFYQKLCFTEKMLKILTIGITQKKNTEKTDNLVRDAE